MSDKPDDSTPTYGSPGALTPRRTGSPGELTARETLPPFPLRAFRRMVQLTTPEFDRLVAALKQFERSTATVAEAHKLFTTAFPIYRAWERNVGATAIFWARFYAVAAQCMGPRFWPYVQRHPDEFPAPKTLQMYLRIAHNRVVCEPRNLNLVPGNIKALDELNRLAAETPLQPLIDAGEIHARMTVEDVLALRQKHGGWQPGRRRGDRRGDPVDKVRQAIRDYIRDHHGQKARLLGFLQAELLRLDPGATVTLSIEVPDAWEPETAQELDEDDDV
jgi:hypothetical protein